MEPTESALVIVVSEAEPVVQEWRRELDPAAQLGVPAHITLMYPFVPPSGIDDDVIATCTAALRAFSSFEFRLAEVCWFGESVVWIAPHPPNPIVQVTRALLDAFPNYPRYGGAVGDEIIPHLTIGDGGPPDRMLAAASDVARRLPIAVQAKDIELMVGSREPASWGVLRSLPLVRASG